MRRKASQRTFIEGLKRVRWHDVKTAWKLLPSMLAAPLYRLKHPNMWLICEDANEARDNGYWFFKYVREHHPEQECVYAIKSSSPDYERVAALGRTVEYGSLEHWVMYLASSKKISSQKAGNPNAALFYLLEVYGLLRNKRIFLQHGVIKNDLKWLYYDVTKMTRFICGAYPEWEYVRDTFGYPQGSVFYTGLCRFDGLHDGEPDPRLVLIMPTWREWIADEDWRLKEYEGTTVIPETNYFRKWTEFITDSRLEELAVRYGVEFVFYPHRNMQKYLDSFPQGSGCVQVAGAADWEIQELLKRASLMVTDYSSVFFDFAYMKKPIVFYQFDYEMFRMGQYEEGYFDYPNNPFGKGLRDIDSVFAEIEHYLDKDYAISKAFANAHKRFFPLYDCENCRRVYDVVRDA